MPSTRNAYLTAIIVIIFTFTLSARGQATDECAAVLLLTGNNVTSRESKEATVSAQAEQFCDSRYELMTQTSKQEVEASYSVFSASYGGSSGTLREFRTNYCRDGHQTFSSQRQVSEYSRQAYAAAVEAWRTCTKLKNENLLVVPAGDDRIITFALTNRTDVRRKLIGVQSSPSNAFECRALTPTGAPIVSLGGTQYILEPGRPFNVSCTRSITVANDGTLLASAASLTISTSVTTSPYFLRFPELAIPDLRTVNARELSDQIASLRKELASINDSKLNKDSWPDGKYVILRNGSCPAGFRQVDTHINAMRMFPGGAPNPPLEPEYLRKGTFGDSSINRFPCPAGTDYLGALLLSTCVKD